MDAHLCGGFSAACKQARGGGRLAGMPRPLRRPALASLAVATEPSPLPFAVREVDAPLGSPGRSVRLVVPASEDELLDAYINSGRGDCDPFFGSVWPSSLALAACISSSPGLVRGRRCLDAGCGLGLGGLSAALCGASAVVLADFEHLALQCCARSVAANGLSLSALSLSESLSPDAPQPPPGQGRLHTLHLDWFAPPQSLQSGVDVLLLADCLYEKSAAEPLARLAAFVLPPGGLLLLADAPNRTPAHRAHFVRLLCEPEEGEAPFVATQDDEVEVVDADGARSMVRLLRFTRR